MNIQRKKEISNERYKERTQKVGSLTDHHALKTYGGVEV
jgi:hypothetical protein